MFGGLPTPNLATAGWPGRASTSAASGRVVVLAFTLGFGLTRGRAEKLTGFGLSFSARPGLAGGLVPFADHRGRLLGEGRHKRRARR